MSFIFFSKIRVRTVHPVQVALDYSTTMCRVAFSNPSVYCYISSAHQDQRLESSVPLFDLVLGCLLYITEACNNVHAKLALLMRNLHCSHSDSVPPTAGTKANDEVPGFVLFRIWGRTSTHETMSVKVKGLSALQPRRSSIAQANGRFIILKKNHPCTTSKSFSKKIHHCHAKLQNLIVDQSALSFELMSRITARVCELTSSF